MLKRAFQWLKTRKWKMLAWPVFFLLLSSLIFVATLTPSYHQCTKEREQAYSEQEQSSSEKNSVVRFVLCEGAAIDANSALLTAVATIFVAAFTLTLWRATSEQGRLTRKAIDESKKSSERQLRAYVGVDGMAFEITSTQAGYVPIDPNSVGIIYPDFLAIKVRNFGQTPAKNVTLIVGIGRGPHLLRMPDNFDYDAELSKPLTGKNIIMRAYLNKDQTEIVKSAVFDAREIWDTKAKKAGTIVFGRIFYTDAFDRNWSTKFCYVWEPWHGPGERFVPYETFNGEDQRKPPQ
jgi:hypothetical protein